MCYNCGNHGHLSKECGEPLHDKVCYNCGESGHLFRTCPTGAQSKASSETPNSASSAPDSSSSAAAPAASSAPATAASDASQTADSTATSATLISDSQDAKDAGAPIPTGPAATPVAASSAGCYKCGKPGHISRFCKSNTDGGASGRPARANRSSAPHKGQLCYSCGQFGHFSRDCTNGQKCYNCGEMGHVSRDCGETQGKVCYSCKQTGHISAECPSLVA